MTGGDSAGVSQTDAGRPWAAAAAALLVIHGVAAALIISRERRHSIYPHRGHADHERTKTMIRDAEIRPEQSATVYLIAGGRAGGIGCSDGRR